MSGAMPIFGMLLILLVIVLPLAAGIVLIVMSRRGGLGYPACGACQYNLSATVGRVDRCPECGAMFVDAGILPPRGKRKPVLLWAGIVLLILPLTCLGFGSLTMSRSFSSARAAAAQARQQAIAAQQAQQQAQDAAAAADASQDAEENPDAVGAENASE